MDGRKTEEFKLKMSLLTKGRVFTVEHKKKLSENHKGTRGMRFSKQHKARIASSVAKLWGTEYRKKQKLTWVEKAKFHPEWGLDYLEGKDAREYRSEKLRREIRERDGNRCTICSSGPGKKKDLPVHHKDFDKRNNLPSNLTTLCDSCHVKIHASKTPA